MRERRGARVRGFLGGRAEAVVRLDRVCARQTRVTACIARIGRNDLLEIAYAFRDALLRALVPIELADGVQTRACCGESLRGDHRRVRACDICRTDLDCRNENGRNGSRSADY